MTPGRGCDEACFPSPWSWGGPTFAVRRVARFGAVDGWTPPSMPGTTTKLSVLVAIGAKPV